MPDPTDDGHAPRTPPAPRRALQAALLVAALLGHGLGAVRWQDVLRRTGMPATSPRADPVRSAVAVGVSAAGGLLASAAAGTVLVALTRVPRDRVAEVLAPATLGLLAPLPVLGPVVSSAVQSSVAWRCARAGTAEAGVAAARLAIGLVASDLVHDVLSGAVRRLLAVTAPAPAVPAPAAPDPTVNVVGPDEGDSGSGPDGFVVYLDGVGRYQARTTPVGRAFAAALVQRLPRWVVVLSLLPQDVTQLPATRRPVTGGLWRRLDAADRRWSLARGTWEAVVALDPRYRDAVAAQHTRHVVAHLEAAGYRSGSGVPVVLVGFSGGAQTALRTASEVARSLGGAPLDVVTIGGFADGSADLGGVRRVHAIVSWGDPVELLPVLSFPSRWTALGVGAWQRAKRAGTVVVRRHDWATHLGAGSYLSEAASAPDGRSRLAQSADVVAGAARELLGGRSRVGSR